LGTLVEGLATMGMHHEAAALYEPLMDVMADGGVLWLKGTFEGAAAIAAACTERWDVAESHFANAAAVAERLSHIPARERTRWWCAWMLRRRGAADDAARAAVLLREALAINEQYALRWRARFCREALLGL
jgi:hypothetical protein